MLVKTPLYKVRRFAGQYYVYVKSSCISIRKVDKLWKPEGSSYAYHPTLRDAIFAVLERTL